MNIVPGKKTISLKKIFKTKKLGGVEINAGNWKKFQKLIIGGGANIRYSRVN